MPRPPWPWYRADRGSWWITIGKKQVCLDEDREVALEKFHQMMRQLGRKPRPPRVKSFGPRSEFVDEGWRQIYFIRNTANGCIKIGRSENVRERFKSLQAANVDPLELLGFVVAQGAYEDHLHRKFRQFRIRGEWFRDDPALISFIEDLLMTSER